MLSHTCLVLVLAVLVTSTPADQSLAVGGYHELLPALPKYSEYSSLVSGSHSHAKRGTDNAPSQGQTASTDDQKSGPNRNTQRRAKRRRKAKALSNVDLSTSSEKVYLNTLRTLKGKPLDAQARASSARQIWLNYHGLKHPRALVLWNKKAVPVPKIYDAAKECLLYSMKNLWASGGMRYDPEVSPGWINEKTIKVVSAYLDITENLSTNFVNEHPMRPSMFERYTKPITIWEARPLRRQLIGERYLKAEVTACLETLLDWRAPRAMSAIRFVQGVAIDPGFTDKWWMNEKLKKKGIEAIKEAFTEEALSALGHKSGPTTEQDGKDAIWFAEHPDERSRLVEPQPPEIKPWAHFAGMSAYAEARDSQNNVCFSPLVVKKTLESWQGPPSQTDLAKIFAVYKASKKHRYWYLDYNYNDAWVAKRLLRETKKLFPETYASKIEAVKGQCLRHLVSFIKREHKAHKEHASLESIKDFETTPSLNNMQSPRRPERDWTYRYDSDVSNVSDASEDKTVLNDADAVKRFSRPNSNEPVGSPKLRVPHYD